MKQPPLFELPPEVPQPDPKPRWYFISDPRTEYMLITDDCGRWAWAEYDLQYGVPHLFNAAASAHKVLRDNQGLRGYVVLYPFTAKWWQG